MNVLLLFAVKICEVNALSNDTNRQLFGVGPSNGTKMPHLYSTSKILEFSKQFGEVSPASKARHLLFIYSLSSLMVIIAIEKIR